MLELCLPGTGAMMPLPGRGLAALLLRREGHVLLVDCGEGTQVAIRKSGFSMARIDAICLTHFHADHVAGLPGLLLTMGTCGRRAPVRLIGPQGLQAVVRCLLVIAPELAFPLEWEEMEGAEYATSFHDLKVTAFALSHVIPCYGYSFFLPRPARFDPAKAQALGIPVAFWKTLQSGQAVDTPKGRFTPGQVTGRPRKGLKVTYCTDTRPIPAIAARAAGADLFLCEGTYPDGTKADKAAEYGHMTFLDAANLARQAQARELLLTHFSPAIDDPNPFLPAARDIFPGTFAGEDNLHRVLRFEDGDEEGDGGNA